MAFLTISRISVVRTHTGAGMVTTRTTDTVETSFHPSLSYIVAFSVNVAAIFRICYRKEFDVLMRT